MLLKSIDLRESILQYRASLADRSKRKYSTMSSKFDLFAWVEAFYRIMLLKSIDLRESILQYRASLADRSKRKYSTMSSKFN